MFVTIVLTFNQATNLYSRTRVVVSSSFPFNILRYISFFVYTRPLFDPFIDLADVQKSRGLLLDC